MYLFFYEIILKKNKKNEKEMKKRNEKRKRKESRGVFINF
jgi:hypothetical protein